MSRVCFCGRPLTWRDLIRSVKNNFVSPAAYLNTHQLGAHSGLVNSSKKGTRPIAAASYQLGLMCTMSWLDGHWAQQGISDSILLMKYAKTYTFVNIWNAGRGILFAHYLKALKTLLYIIISAQQDLKIQWLPNEEGTTQRQHFWPHLWQHIDELSKKLVDQVRSDTCEVRERNIHDATRDLIESHSKIHFHLWTDLHFSAKQFAFQNIINIWLKICYDFK